MILLIGGEIYYLNTVYHTLVEGATLLTMLKIIGQRGPQSLGKAVCVGFGTFDVRSDVFQPPGGTF